MIQAAVYTSEAELIAAYKLRRAKDAERARRAATANQNAPAVKREAEPRDMEFFPIPRRPAASIIPAWQIAELYFDHHVNAWRSWKAEEGMKCKAHIRRRCADLGVSYDDLMGPSRKKKIVQARDLLAYEIKTTVRPQISWPELGRLLNREHSAIFYSVMKMRAAAGDPDAIASIEKRKARMNKARAAFNSRKEQGE